MLVLSRRLGEEILIDGQIHVIVVGIHKNRIRLGISAPHSFSVDRKEIHERRSVEGAKVSRVGDCTPGLKVSAAEKQSSATTARRA